MADRMLTCHVFLCHLPFDHAPHNLTTLSRSRTLTNGTCAWLSMQLQIKSTREIMSDHGGHAFKFAVQEEERSQLWQARHTAYWACLAMRPGCGGYPTDICVPISRLSESITLAQKTCQVRACVLQRLVARAHPPAYTSCWVNRSRIVPGNLLNMPIAFLIASDEVMH